MMNSISKRVEISVLYGQSGLGKIASSANVDADSTDITLTAASWAPGIWAGAENARVVIYNGTTLLCGGEWVVSRVNLSTRTFRVTRTGQAATLDSTIASNPGVLDLYFYTAVSGSSGTFAHQDFAGLDKIITNTGTLFNISAASYALWRGNTYDCGGAALTLGKIFSAVALAVERGLDEDAVCLISNKTWANIASDQAALRMYDQSYKPGKAEAGHESFSFHAQNGKIEIVESIYVKEGEAFIFPVKRLKRIGAIDISFKMPGRTQQEDFFMELADGAGYELRCYTDQALFCETPAKLVKIYNIVNS